MNLTAIAAAVSAAIAGAAGFAVAWNIQAKILLDTKLEHSDAIIQQQRGARAIIEHSALALTKAQNDAQDRRVVISAAVNSNRDGLIGLRNAAASVRAAATTPDASAAYADTVSELFDKCGTELVRVAGHADGHVSDIKTLTDSWVTTQH